MSEPSDLATLTAYLQVLGQLNLHLSEQVQAQTAEVQALRDEVARLREAQTQARAPAPLTLAITDLVRQSGSEPWVRRMVGAALFSGFVLAFLWGLSHIVANNTDALTLLFQLLQGYLGKHAPTTPASPSP